MTQKSICDVAELSVCACRDFYVLWANLSVEMWLKT